VAASTSKKVAVVRFDREPIAGFIDPASFWTAEGLELLTPSGAVSLLPALDIKAVCFLRDFEPAAAWKENRLFASRPKTEGVWVRFVFRDGDQLDGLMPNNLLAWEPQGFTVAPAAPTFQSQRVFIPRTAVSETKVMGVVGTQPRQRRGRKPEGQLEMF